MILKKVFNNNAVLAEDDTHLECVILGKGIAFQKKPGSLIDEADIDKIFVLKSNETMDMFFRLMEEVPVNRLELTIKIVEQAQKDLNTKFDDIVYIALADHLNYALNRYKEGVNLGNAMLWEIKKFYSEEYKAAQNSLKIIQYYEGVELNEDEAGFIALHFVNSQLESEGRNQALQMMQVLQEMLDMVEVEFNIRLNRESISYGRFLTHLKFLIKRILTHDLYTGQEEDILYHQVVNKYKDAFSCSERLCKFLENKYDTAISLEEIIYLTLHLQRAIK